MFSEIAAIIKDLGQPRVLVVGDIMLDHFTFGGVRRLAPEAPTPILSMEDEQFQLGGAGFTANVLQQMGATVTVAAVTGSDSGGRRIRQLLEEQGISGAGVVEDASRPSTRKQRLIARDFDLPSGQQQLLRLDTESKEPISGAVEAALVNFIREASRSCDAIVVSDYAKGVLTKALRETIIAAAAYCPVIADPAKGTPLLNWRGVTAMKPNRYETEAAVGFSLKTREDIRRAGRQLVEQAQLKYVIVSLDADGLFYCDRTGQELFVPTRKLDVYDVAGAGDSVISSMALLASQKIDPRHLLEIANLAAGIMITQKAPKHISRADLLHRLVTGDESVRSKLKTAEELTLILESSANRSRTTYFTNGYFDNISPAQILFLEQLGQFKGLRIVAINSDASIRASGHQPRLPEADRLRLLQLFDCIDYIVTFDEQDASALIRQLRPQIFLKGANYRGQVLAEAQALDEAQCRVEYVTLKLP